MKLDKALGGIRNMGGSPDLVFIIDINRESLAIAEAKKLGVPIMAILDTNVNPDGVIFPIPGNDDSVKAIKLYCRLISDAALAGIKENMATSGVDISKLDGASSESILEAANAKKSTNQKPEFKKDTVIKKADRKDGDKPFKSTGDKKDSKHKAPEHKKPAAKKPAAKPTEKKSS